MIKSTEHKLRLTEIELLMAMQKAGLIENTDICSPESGEKMVAMDNGFVVLTWSSSQMRSEPFG